MAYCTTETLEKRAESNLSQLQRMPIGQSLILTDTFTIVTRVKPDEYEIGYIDPARERIIWFARGPLAIILDYADQAEKEYESTQDTVQRYRVAGVI